MKYRALVENAIDAVYLLELNEDRVPIRFLEVNPVGCKRFGYSRDELLLMPCADVINQNSTMLLRTVQKIKEGLHSFTLQDEYVFASGIKLQLEFSVCNFNLGEREVLLVISRDITERVQTEALLRKSEKLAVVGQLATAIAHEIRNPLTAIKGFIQLLPSTLNSENQWYVDVMSSEIEQIELITNEFMSVAKPQQVRVQSNNLCILTEQVVILLQPQATINNIQIRMECEPNIPLVSCEKNQVKQMFINILKNAIEAMPTGGDILIKIIKSDDHQVSIRFIDEGEGIPHERIPYLGEPFYSLKEQGIGLGLMVCYKIIEAHQGKIVIESEMGKGTIVDVMLPIDAFQTQNIDSGTRDKQQVITHPNLD